MITLILKYILRHFGEFNQISKCCEELDEFKHEIRHRSSKEKILDEMADAIIMILQMKILFGISWIKLILRIFYKLFRTLFRIRSDYYE